jgi:hypothetical protein
MKLVKLFSAFAIAGALATGIANAQDAANRQTVSDGERALDTWQVQNLMSTHEYYHAAGFNLEEVDALWVSPNGEYAKTACFFSPSWVMQGVATVRKLYGDQHVEDSKKNFDQLKAIYPELANVDFRSTMVGAEWAMHTSTTPVIEVAGDGKTAKGIWYSPGMGLMPHINGKSVAVGGIFFWEKYSGDFVKENGQWKIWHLGMYYDFTPSLPDSMTGKLGNGVEASPQAAGQGGAPQGGQGAPAQQDNREKGEQLTAEQIANGGMLPDPYKYESWSPTRKNAIVPRPPEPYYTFSETFSYAPYDKNNQYNWKK